MPFRPTHRPPRGSRTGWRPLLAGGLAAVFLMGAPSGVAAQGFPTPLAPLTVRSVTGQFIIHGERPKLAPPGIVPEVRDEEWIDLDPNVLAVLAERVREAMDRRLGGLGAWRGKIELTLRPAAGLADSPIRIVPQHLREGCQVTLAVPDRIQVQRLVRALVEAIVLEAANREGRGGIAQAPLWLNEGLAGIIHVESGPRFLLEQGTTFRREGRRPDALRRAHQLLAGENPLTFSEMGLVRVEDLTAGPVWDRYQASSILLTAELLREPWGREGIRTFIDRLGRHLNWQTTFLEVFSRQWVTLLEVEKWWAVSAAHELARDPSQQWEPAVVLEALAGIATEVTEIRSEPDAPPVRRRVPLAEMVTGWEDGLRRPVLERKLGELNLLYAHTPPDLGPFVVAWYEALKGFLGGDRRPTGAGAVRPGVSGTAGRRERQLLRRLDELVAELERRRSALAEAC